MPLAKTINLDEGAIVEACKNYSLLQETDGCFHRDEEVMRLIRYTDDTVVKFGHRLDETVNGARNQAYVCQVLDPRIVRVPKVYHYFEAVEGKGRRGYTVMECIQGKTCDWLPTKDEFRKILAIIEHLATLHGKIPRPVGGGKSANAMFYGATEKIASVSQLEEHFNSRLFDGAGNVWCKDFWRICDKPPQTVRFEESQLVLVHGQLNPLNIIWCTDGTPALLDWSEAGFYPRFFEQACLESHCYNGDGTSYLMAMRKLQTLNEHDECEKEKVHHASVNSERFDLFIEIDLGPCHM